MDILRRAAGGETFCALSFLKIIAEDCASDFAAMWQASIEADEKLALDQNEKELLIRFGRALGTTDAETQLILCERFRSQLDGRLKAAAARRAEITRLLLGGTAVAALILFALIL